MLIVLADLMASGRVESGERLIVASLYDEGCIRGRKEVEGNNSVSHQLPEQTASVLVNRSTIH